MFDAGESTMSESSIRLATPDDASAWNAFAEAHPETHLAHSFEWSLILSSVFGHKPHYFVAETHRNSGTQITGVLPLFLVKSALFGRALISVPYLNGGGTLAESDAVRSKLIDSACELGAQLEVNYVELRHRAPIALERKSLVVKSHKVAMVLPLMSDPENLFAGFPAKLRSQIRRPEKAGLISKVFSESEQKAAVDAFFQVFSRNMRDLGTPSYPKALFEQVVKTFRNRARIVSVFDKSTPVAGGLTLGWGNTVEIPWASALKEYNSTSPNMLLYWESIRSSCRDGYSAFDFGRCSRDSGSYRFKAQWGAKEVPLYWHYSVLKGSVPDVSPTNSRFSFFVKCWRMLPVPIANILGRYLSRSIP